MGNRTTIASRNVPRCQENDAAKRAVPGRYGMPLGEKKVFPQGGHHERSSILGTIAQRPLLRNLGYHRLVCADCRAHWGRFPGGAFLAAGLRVFARYPST